MKGLALFMSQSLGINLWPGESEVLEGWATSGKRKGVFALGRRSGKGILAAGAAIYVATMLDYTDDLRPGEAWFILNVANRIEQARELLRVVREILTHAPDQDLRSLIDPTTSTQDQIGFKTGAIIRAMPCSSKSTPGLAVALLIFDEIARMSTAESGFQAGQEVYTALSPSTIQFGDRGYIMLTSSPMGPSGIFYKLFEQGRTQAVPDIFTVQRPTWEMNPKATRASLESDFLADPEGSRQNFGAEFIEGSGAYLTVEAITACVVKGRTALPPEPGVRYFAVSDPAEGRPNGDRFAYAIGHLVGSGDKAVVVIDMVKTWRGRKSPINTDSALDELAEFNHQYHNPEVITDQYGGELIKAALSRRGVVVRVQKRNNALNTETWGAMRRAINREAIELLDDPLLIAELCSLEQTPTSTGLPRVEAARGHHDDVAVVVSTLCHAMQVKKEPSAFAETPGWLENWGAINQRLKRSGPAHEHPFGFGSSGRASIQDPSTKDFNMAQEATWRRQSKSSPLPVHQPAALEIAVRDWMRVNSFRTNNPHQVEVHPLVKDQDPAAVIRQLDAAVAKIAEVKRLNPEMPPWEPERIISDKKDIGKLLDWMARE